MGWWAWMGLDPKTNRLEGRFQNGACQQQCPCGRIDSPQNGCCRRLCPQDELWLPPASLGDSPRSAGRSASGYWQMAASALILEQVRFLCAPFKSGDSISHSSLGLPKVSPTGLQRQMFWGLIFLAQDRWPGEADVGLRPFPPWGEAL